MLESTSPTATPAHNWSAHSSALDGLRGVAILMVLSYHFYRSTSDTAFDVVVAHFAMSGWMGVDLFFVLSGFLIAGILIDSKGSPHYLRNFYMRRVLRIFPLYYLFLFVVFSIVPRVTYVDDAVFQYLRHHQKWFYLYLQHIWIA